MYNIVAFNLPKVLSASSLDFCKAVMYFTFSSKVSTTDDAEPARSLCEKLLSLGASSCRYERFLVDAIDLTTQFEILIEFGDYRYTIAVF